MPHAVNAELKATPAPNALRRLALVAVLLALPSAALAQGMGNPNDPFGSPAARPAPPAGLTPQRQATKGLSEFATEELVSEIRVRGNRTVPASRITHQMQTRVGRPYDPKALAADIKKLASLPYFVTVRPLHRSTEAGRVIVLEVVERRALRYVEYLGNEKVKDKKLAEATGLDVGGAVDPYAVEEGKKKIEAFYREQGYGRAHVEILEGQKASDQGVVYSVNEGSKEKIWAVEFEGNRFASDGQLKTKIRSKPGIARLFGGKLNRETLDADVQALTAYYRSFGFFRARVGRSVELNDAGTWATVRFAINEGQRYQVRNVTLNGVEVFESGSVREGLQLDGGQVFEQAKMQKDVQWLRDLYGSRGYVFADIQPQNVFLEEPGKIDLVYNIQEGEQWRVGAINVNIVGEAAHTRIQTAMNRLSLAPGDILDTRKLRDSERRIGASSVFNTNPALGPTPKIAYTPDRVSKRRLAELAKEKEEGREGVFRGQSPTSQRHTSYKPPAPVQPVAYNASTSSAYQVQQSQGGSPESALFTSGTAYAAPPAPQNQVASPTTYPIAGSGYPNPPAYPTASPTFPNTAAPPAYPSTQYGGSAVAPTGPGTAPIGQSGAPVQPIGAAPVSMGVAPTQYAQGYANPNLAPPTYGQPSPPPPAYTAPSNAQPSYPTTAAPNYGYSPVRASPPPVPVNTQLFPTQVYAPTQAPPPNDPFYADLNLDLAETQTGRFMIGAAVNSDAGVVGQISLDERNFDWRRFPRSFQDFYDGTAFRGGGQRFRLEAAPGTEVQRYLASWQEPYLFDSPISLSLSGSYFDRRYDDWDENRLGGRVGLGYQWVDRDLSASVTYRGENVEISNIDTSAALIQEYADVQGDNSLHGFGLRLVTDKRDNPFLATDGYYLSLALEQVVGSHSYGRAEIDARTYLLLRERPDHTGRHVLTFQNRTGFTGADTPIYDRFYAGGFSTMRGFDFRGASPKILDREVGGDFMFINTLEYMFPITADDMINGVVFVDHGTVNEDITFDNYRVAPGVGLRVTVPAMGPAPIALDFAWPIAGPGTDEERVFTFNVGFQR